MTALQSNIVPFPSPRRCQRDGAYGELSIHINRHQGRADPPSNVCSLLDLMPSALPETPELALFIAMCSTMTAGQVSDLRKRLKEAIEQAIARGRVDALLAYRKALSFMEQVTRPKEGRP